MMNGMCGIKSIARPFRAYVSLRNPFSQGVALGYIRSALSGRKLRRYKKTGIEKTECVKMPERLNLGIEKHIHSTKNKDQK